MTKEKHYAFSQRNMVKTSLRVFQVDIKHVQIYPSETKTEMQAPFKKKRLIGGSLDYFTLFPKESYLETY